MSVGTVGVGGASGNGIVSGASVSAPPANKMSNLFAQIDTNGTGAITQDQFNQAFQTMNPPGVFKAAGAASIFSQLDPNGTGSVLQPDFVNTMTGLMKSLRSGQPSGTAGGSASSQNTSPAGTLASSLQSLNQLGGSSDPLSSGGLGSIVNVRA